VGVFVDGVYQVSRDAIDLDLLDLDRVEVAHGPQSALFGHSSFSGLIHYVPAAAAEHWIMRATVDAGSQSLLGIQGVISGPLGATFKGRLAASWREQDGSWTNPAGSGSKLGGQRKRALAGTLATRDGAGPLTLRLSARFGENRFDQPAFFTLDHRQFNCGARNAQSGTWSYFCGVAPVGPPNPLSPRIPDSRSWAAQAALHAELDLGAIELRSDTSWYRASARIYRDFDGSAEGDIYGVCATNLNCENPGSLLVPVVRLQRVNIVQVRPTSASEVAQELRIASTGSSAFRWMLGATMFRTRARRAFAYGADRGSLQPAERFTSLVLGSLQRVGPLAAINSAVVGDANASQVMHNDSIEQRRTFALFGSIDYRLTPQLRLHGEIRGNWEHLELDSRRSNFTASFGRSLGVRRFFDTTPRLSIDYRPSAGWMFFASHARGSRSGGINSVAGLAAEEQTFEPETNWTSEIGVKYAGPGVVRSVEVTGYHIDWRKTQILGLSVTPGVNALVTRNTNGIETWGFDLSARFQPRPWLELDFALGYTRPRFKRGSEDPGSSAFCGLGPGSTTSSFCTIRESTINPGQLVPDISGKVVLRTTKVNWSGALTLTPGLTRFSDMRLRLGMTHQGNVYERAVNGLAYGARTILDARLVLPLGRTTLEVWGTNLANARYARGAAGRQPQFYTGIPRPTDLILGESRRIGLTLRFSD
jgi:iron complex outermembrane receptor protein